MIRYPLLQIVDAPHVDATVIADLNAHYGADVITEKEGFSLGAPSLSGDAGRRRRTWGKRRLALPVFVAGDRAVAVAQHRVLARATTRDGWVRFQLSPDTDSVWFRTYATEQGPVSFDLFHSSRSGDDLWRFELALDADRFAVGAEVALGPYVVPNTTTSGGMRVELPEVEGDMPAPATVKIARAGGRILGPSVGVSTYSPKTYTPTSWGPAVNPPAAWADLFIAGEHRQTTGALSDWSNVATFTPTAMPAGRFRLLVRLGGSSASGAFAARWRVMSSIGSATSEPVVIDVSEQVRWVDTGQAPWPLRDTSAFGVPGATQLVLQVRRLDAGGELRFDNQLFMFPESEDSSLLRLRVADTGTTDATVLIDSAERAALGLANASPLPAPMTRGGWPELTPGRDNWMTIWQNLDPALSSGRDVHTAPSTVTVTYRPQYLWGVA